VVGVSALHPAIKESRVEICLAEIGVVEQLQEERNVRVDPGDLIFGERPAQRSIESLRVRSHVASFAINGS
jgi:hypothetical protein